MTRALLLLTALTLTLACAGLGPAEHALDASDHAVLVERSDLEQALPGLSIPAGAESWSKRRSLGSWELDYTFEAEDFDLTTRVTVEGSVSEAESTMWAYGVGSSMLGALGVEYEPADDLVTVGDARSCGLLRRESVAVGNFCVVRSGASVLLFTVVGVYWRGPGELDAVLAGPVGALAGYTPVAAPLP